MTQSERSGFEALIAELRIKSVAGGRKGSSRDGKVRLAYKQMADRLDAILAVPSPDEPPAQSSAEGGLAALDILRDLVSRADELWPHETQNTDFEVSLKRAHKWLAAQPTAQTRAPREVLIEGSIPVVPRSEHTISATFHTESATVHSAPPERARRFYNCAYVTRIACPKDADQSQFQRELQEQAPPSAEAAAIPLRLIL
jgi:hypothetical protein